MTLFKRLIIAALAAALAIALPAVTPARATVQTSSNKTIVLGDGTTTAFTFNFIGVASAYISVIYTDASGNETVLTQGSGTTQYQISLNAPVTGAVWGVGGTVTYAPNATPIAAGTSLTIFRTLPLTQAISLQNQNSLARLGNGAETGLDTGVMQSQQISENIARAIVAPIVDATPPAPLPPIAQRANQGAAFDSQGNLVAGSTPASGVISSAMQPVVNAATLALGRSAFGLGNIAVETMGCGLGDDGAGNVRLTYPVTQVATNQAIHKANCFSSYITTGPITFTLDRANTLFPGFGFWIYNTSAGAITLTPNAADAFQGYSSGQAVNLPPNVSAYVSTDAGVSGNWLVQYALSASPPASQGGFTNLVITNNSGTPNSQIDVSAGDIVVPNLLPGGGVKFANAAFTINCATTGVNGMDTGTLPTSGWVYVYAISNGATVAGLASLSSSAPTMPTGYTYRKRIGAMRTDSSAHFFRTRQLGAKAVYQVTSATNTTALPVVASGTQTPWTAFPVSGVTVPTTAIEVRLILFASLNANSNTYIAVAPNNNYSTSITAGTPTAFGGNANTTTTAVINAQSDLLLENSNIYVGTTGGFGAATVSMYGWTDNI